MEHTPNNTPATLLTLTVAVEKEQEIDSFVKFDGYYLIDTEDYHLIYKRLINNKHYSTNKEMFESTEYKFWRRAVIAEFYADFYITSEELTYKNKPEQLRKINHLRLNQEIEKGKKSKYYFSEHLEKSKKWEIGHYIHYKVYDIMKGSTDYKGEIYYIYKKKGMSTGIFDIKVGKKIFKKIGYEDLSCRKSEDYRNVIIPEDLKEMTTKELLQELNDSRKPWYHYRDSYYYNHTIYEYKAIKAELSTREHITRRNELKNTSKKRSNKNKNKNR